MIDLLRQHGRGKGFGLRRKAGQQECGGEQK